MRSCAQARLEAVCVPLLHLDGAQGVDGERRPLSGVAKEGRRGRCRKEGLELRLRLLLLLMLGWAGEEGGRGSALGRVGRGHEGTAGGGGGEGEGEGEDATMLAELELPRWVRKVDVAAPLEALGRFYAHQGKAEYVPFPAPLFSR